MGATRQLSLDRSERWLLVLLLVVLGYFHGGAASNQNSRLDAIYSFVEPGSPDFLSFRIDRFMLAPERGINTADWARAGGHYYSNKAPGTALLAIPFYASVYTLERLVGVDLRDPRVQIGNAYLVNLWASVLVLALGAIAFRRVLLHTGTSTRIATLLTLATVLGTGLFPYSTQLWGHATAAGLIAIALHAYVVGTPASLVVAGAAAGSAVLCDYLSILFAAGLSLLTLVRHRQRVLLVVLGGAVPALCLMGYDAACFGSPFTLSTAVNNPAFQVQGRALGAFGAPSPEVLEELLVGLRRGLLLQTPLLVPALVGMVRWYRRDARDGLLWLCAGTVLAFLLANAAFNGWHGGATVQPRYLLPCLPLLCLALKEVPPYGLPGRTLYLVGLVSALNMLAIAAVNPLCPDQHANPLYGYTWDMFLAGRLSPYPFPIRLQQLHALWPQLKHLAMWNWGQLAGLHGLWSLGPLALVAVIAHRTRPPELRKA